MNKINLVLRALPKLAGTLGMVSGLVVTSAAVAANETATTTSTTTATTAATSTTTAGGSPTDAQIAAVMMTANEGEISEAKLAQKSGVNKDVKDFAAHMLKEHTTNEKDEKSLMKKAGVKADTSFPQVADMKKDAKEKAAELKKTKGADFDKTYIDHQVAMHQELLSNLNEKLIPAAQNSDMKAYLENTKSHVEAHLERAKHLQTTLTK